MLLAYNLQNVHESTVISSIVLINVIFTYSIHLTYSIDVNQLWI